MTTIIKTNIELCEDCTDATLTDSYTNVEYQYSGAALDRRISQIKNGLLSLEIQENGIRKGYLQRSYRRYRLRKGDDGLCDTNATRACDSCQLIGWRDESSSRWMFDLVSDDESPTERYPAPEQPLPTLLSHIIHTALESDNEPW